MPRTGWMLAVVVGLLLLNVPRTYASQRVPVFGGAVERAAFSRFSASLNHTCLVTVDGSVHCWGANQNGSLGDGTAANRTVPVSVTVNNLNADLLLSVVAVSVGAFHSCALKSDGTVWCWGSNSAGQLGFDTSPIDEQRRASQVTGLSDVVAIAAGRFFTCALRVSGTVACWGQYLDTIALLPSDPTGTVFTASAGFIPRSIAGLSGVTAVAAGDAHVCALLVAGTVRCWGSDVNGQLGNGGTGVQRSPVSVTGLDRVRQISAQRDVTCAVLGNGAARCWGRDNAGQLGDLDPSNAGDVDVRRVPVAVQTLIDTVEVRVGDGYACAMKAQGTMACWGIGPATNTLKPADVPGLQNVGAIAAGSDHACALIADGTAKCFGSNAAGQLGRPAVSQSTTPVGVANISGSIGAIGVAAAANGSHACAVRSNGLMACWGNNGAGQIGDGTTTGRRLPVAVSGISNVIGAGLGANHSCAVIADGTLRCWGSNQDGQLGIGSVGGNQPLPSAIGGLTGVVAVAPATFHTCALLVSGFVRCWGLGSGGEMGNGHFDSHPTPFTVDESVVSDAVAIASAFDSTCVLIADGTERCWGSNADDALGDGVAGGLEATPVPVAGLNGAIAISGSCAVLVVGRVNCWGPNRSGQVGDGSLVDRPAPVLGGIFNAIQVSRSAVHTCAVGVTGLAFCWGDNGHGELGDGTFNDQPRSVPVSNLSAVTGVAAGGFFTCALRVNGRVSCWGENGTGQLGNNSLVDSPVSIDVPSFSFNINPAVALEANPRKATVSVIAVCDLHARVSVEVQVQQGAVSGKGRGEADCTGALMQFPVSVEAEGRQPFGSGPAQVTADALVRMRGTFDRQQWTRQVQLAAAP
jgi:alpha-tubulin suppressor-like RCC1 family protein